MIDVEKFREDMRSGTPLDEVLKKHNLDIKTAMNMLIKYNNPPKKTKKRKRKNIYSKTDELNIYKVNNQYIIKKSINKCVKSFGGYDTLEDAIKVRDYLNKHGWYHNRLKTAWKNCGVKKEEW